MQTQDSAAWMVLRMQRLEPLPRHVGVDGGGRSIGMPQQVTDALLHGTGVFAPFLELTKACESGDDVTFARMADELHLSNRQVNWAHLQALAWAEDLNAD